MDALTRSCADCHVLNCDTRKGERPPFCLMTQIGDTAVTKSADYYKSGTVDGNIAQTSAILESETYGRVTRVEEILLFVKRMGYGKIGVASCAGLRRECEIFTKAARAKNVDVYAAICKIGSIDKCEIGLREEEKIRPGHFEAICNPILQAEALNRIKTDFNVIIGLCVGHDTLFIKHSDAPITYLIVKDRVLCHNPVGALYASESYFRRIMQPDSDEKQSIS